MEGGEGGKALEMIKVEPCKGCAGTLLVDRFMGVVVRCDPALVDAQTAGRALQAGVPLYRVHHEGGRPSSFGSASPAVLRALYAGRSPGLQVVPEHRCPPGATGAVLPASQPAPHPGVPNNPPKAPAGPSAPFSGSIRPTSSAPETARTAATPVSETTPTEVLTFEVDPRNPRCKRCGERMTQGTYAAIELGELLVWAEHVDECEKRS